MGVENVVCLSSDGHGIVDDVVIRALKLNETRVYFSRAIFVVDYGIIGKELEAVLHGGIRHDVITASIDYAALLVHGVVAVRDETVIFCNIVCPILNSRIPGAYRIGTIEIINISVIICNCSHIGGASIFKITYLTVREILESIDHSGVSFDVVALAIHSAALLVKGIVASRKQTIVLGYVVDPILNRGAGGAVDVVDIAFGVGDGTGVLGNAVDAESKEAIRTTGKTLNRYIHFCVNIFSINECSISNLISSKIMDRNFFE